MTARLLCTWNSPDKNTGVGCHSLLQGIFLTQGSNPVLLYWQADSLPLSHQGSPLTLYIQSWMCLTLINTIVLVHHSNFGNPLLFFGHHVCLAYFQLSENMILFSFIGSTLNIIPYYPLVFCESLFLAFLYFCVHTSWDNLIRLLLPKHG